MMVIPPTRTKVEIFLGLQGDLKYSQAWIF
jgi:hypothetical protein